MYISCIDSSSKFGWTIPLNNKYAHSITDVFSQFIKTSIRKPNLLETVDGKEYENKIFNDFFKTNNIKRYSRYTEKIAVFAELCKTTKRILLKKPVFLVGKASGISELPSVIKKYNNTIHN